MDIILSLVALICLTLGVELTARGVKNDDFTVKCLGIILIDIFYFFAVYHA